jgi:microcompartment protein CcmL/EutN
MNAIGFMELNSIARGMEVTDAVLKSSSIDLMFAYPSCPGKYYLCFSGTTDSVEAAISVGHEVADSYEVDSVLISNIQDDVIRAMTKTTAEPRRGALGVMEFFSVTASIHAADSAVKTADVDLIEIRPGIGIGGKSFVTLSGTVSAVNAAVQAGTSREDIRGMLVGSAVIANPDPVFFDNLY